MLLHILFHVELMQRKVSMKHNVMCVCVYWITSRVVFINHEVVVLQPQIGNTTGL